jgi:hypothetical protein
VLPIGKHELLSKSVAHNGNLPSMLPIGIILDQLWHQFGSKVLPIALAVAHCQCFPLPTPTKIL